MQVEFGLTPCPCKGKEMGNPIQKWLLAVLKKTLGVKDITPLWCAMRACGLEPLQFNWFQADMHFYTSLAHCNNTILTKVLQSEMQLSVWSDDCWSTYGTTSHRGLHGMESRVFKEVRRVATGLRRMILSRMSNIMMPSSIV